MVRQPLGGLPSAGEHSNGERGTVSRTSANHAEHVRILLRYLIHLEVVYQIKDICQEF